MSVSAIVKQIHSLPYSEMLILSGALANELGSDARKVADAFVKLGALPIAKLNEMEVKEVQAMKTIFGRKRAITVDPVTSGTSSYSKKITGWNLTMSTVQHAPTPCDNIKTGLVSLIDSAILIHIMMKP